MLKKSKSGKFGKQDFYQPSRTFGSRIPYKISTRILIIMNTVAMTKTAPITTGKSKVFSALTISLPNPFQPKMNSTKTAPANIDANQPEVAVITGFNEFFNACFQITSLDFKPLA